MPAGKGKCRPKNSVIPPKTPIGSALLDEEQGQFPLDDIFAGELPSEPSTSRGKKRGYSEGTSYNGEMEKLLSGFGTDFSKSLQTKRKRLETFTHESLISSDKKVKEMCQSQQAERHKLTDEYRRQVTTVFGQWEEDMGKMKDGEEKILTLMKQHHKLFQQQRVVQTQRFKTMKQLHEQFMKGLDTLDRNHIEQASNMQDELKKEMVQLRKKILMDSQQHEISTVRRSLQSMLAQVGEE